MDIHRDEPLSPVRPGFGAAGTPCVVKANHFFVGLVDKGLHHYDVTISPETTLKGVYREVMSKLVSEKRQTELGGRLPAYDGKKSLFTAGELPFKTKEFEVTLPGRTERRYKVQIKHATAVSLHQLMMLMAGYHTDIPAHALQVLDIVLRDIVLNERNDMEYITVGRSFFSRIIDTVSLGQGVEAWKGFYQSIRPTQMGLSVIVDMSSTAFVRPMSLIQFVMEILNKDNPRTFGNITNMDYAKLKKALKGVKVEVTHRGDARRKYRIATLTHSRPSIMDFESSSGVRKTVTDYFREAYQMELQYGFLPCLQVGSDQRPIYLPMEVCKIVPGQQYRKKLESQQVSKLMDSTCQRPSAREANIRQVVKRNDYNSTERSNEFGIEVDYHPTSVQARVLPAPTLKYYGTGSESLCYPKDGQWNMMKKRVVDGARVCNWACINFCHDLQMNHVKKFCSDLVKWSRNTGVDMDELKLPIFIARPSQVEADLSKRCQDARNLLGGQKIGLLLAILPDKNGSLYGNFKRICETEIGIMSQCCLAKYVISASPSYFANVAIKINAKVGGRNTEFANPQESLPVVSSEPTIIFGADVTHPAALDDTAPSIASVVASQDWPKVAKYNGVVRAQGHRQELINGLENIVKDGVSEGQFKQVLEQEIPEIEKAWKSLYNEKPHITFVVVQKRHHTRIFPDNHNDRRWADKSGNILPGTVIDKNICHPTEFDFFLCSHAGIKGTSRPTHYHVLRDDNKFTADGLQSLTYNLCYLYSSCTRSVSIAPPAYYAHKLAFRARFYVNQGSDVAMSGSSSSSSAPTAGPFPLPDIKDELKRSMFYC
ncbi:protein argonaute 18-like [Panicum hallii]|uniref:protein argonaute 18-like n=1 Tax=Panicum hallii TaxID=206008 RepID=UPI000DF4D5A9|nr:protein argonaute 18-like [Panicum hallii]